MRRKKNEEIRSYIRNHVYTKIKTKEDKIREGKERRDIIG